jgi:hypothetical protein
MRSCTVVDAVRCETRVCDHRTGFCPSVSPAVSRHHNFSRQRRPSHLRQNRPPSTVSHRKEIRLPLTIMAYASPYEEAVLTKPHPAKTEFRPLDHPDYIANSRFGSWIATRWEELVVVAFMASVFVYCTVFYAASWTAMYPFRQMVAYSYDVVAACAVVLIVAGRMGPRLPSKRKVLEMPPAEQEKAKAANKAAAKAATIRRRVALALCAAVTIARWQYGDLSAAMAALTGKK